MIGFAVALNCLSILLLLRSELSLRWVRRAIKANHERLDSIWRANHFDSQLEDWAVRRSYKEITDKYWVLVLNLGIWSYKRAFPEFVDH